MAGNEQPKKDGGVLGNVQVFNRFTPRGPGPERLEYGVQLLPDGGVGVFIGGNLVSRDDLLKIAGAVERC